MPSYAISLSCFEGIQEEIESNASIWRWIRLDPLVQLNLDFIRFISLQLISAESMVAGSHLSALSADAVLFRSWIQLNVQLKLHFNFHLWVEYGNGGGPCHQIYVTYSLTSQLNLIRSTIESRRKYVGGFHNLLFKFKFCNCIWSQNDPAKWLQ